MSPSLETEQASTCSEPTPLTPRDSPVAAPSATGVGDSKSPGLPRPRVVSLSSRPPVVQTNGTWVSAPGGLAPIVRRALGDRGGAWVSWSGAGATWPPRSIENVPFELFTFDLAKRDADGFYSGFANRTLWPLFHDMVVQPVFNSTWWSGYANANDACALTTRVALDQVGDDSTVWVHDYHLMLVPERLRSLGVQNPVSFFLHTPFPSPAVFARLPQRRELIQGLSGADLVGFHTEGDRQRFETTWSLFGQGKAPSTVAVPASIDAASFRSDARNPAVLKRAALLRERFDNRIMLFGVERLDYTKGIPERLKALELLLTRRSDLRRRVVYVQVAHPSREKVPEYRRLRATVEGEIGRLNGRFTTPGNDVPFRYLHRAVSQEQLMAYYVAADVALVTPLRDGMNLVAKEYVVTQTAAKGAGALVLSEFAGAAAELTDAILCNPYDIDGTADAIEQAIEMDEDDRRKRLSVMAVQIENNDIEHWADQLLRSVEAPPAEKRLAKSQAGT